MGEIIRFPRPNTWDKAKGRTLCRSGFHQWRLDKNQRFDVRLGRLITVYRCERCGAIRNESV